MGVLKASQKTDEKSTSSVYDQKSGGFDVAFGLFGCCIPRVITDLARCDLT